MSDKQLPNNNYSNARIILFMVVLSFICALVLATLASLLKEPQELAKELDRSSQMLIAAKILTHEDNFLIKDEKGDYIPAKYIGNGILAPGDITDIARTSDIIEVYRKRLVPYLTDRQGNLISFEKAGINKEKYIEDYKKSGYYLQPLKLLYEIIPNENGEKKPIGYVIPVNGIGLWDAIYGYLAVEPDGNTVIGISWYEQKETPGLGADISDEPWQKQFFGKTIFQPDSSGETDFKLAPIGITVVKGKVLESLGETFKAKAAVDGIPGATLTGSGVTKAYRDVLEYYRPFFIKIREEK